MTQTKQCVLLSKVVLERVDYSYDLESEADPILASIT